MKRLSEDTQVVHINMEAVTDDGYKVDAHISIDFQNCSNAMICGSIHQLLLKLAEEHEHCVDYAVKKYMENRLHELES